MEDAIISDVVYEKIKKFDHRSLDKRQYMLIDKLITNEELKKRYKSYGLCEGCKQPNTSHYGLQYWCQPCNAKRFQQNFKNWTSGNRNIDEFIKKAQLRARNHKEAIEWIESDQFENTQYLTEGGFGITYSSKWKDGCILGWDYKNDQWMRDGETLVVLKCLHNSQDITVEFLREIDTHVKMNASKRIIPFYGITKDSKTNNFSMVMKYARTGSLRKHLNDHFYSMSWKRKLESLFDIAQGLKDIHDNNLIHHDFHSGNIINDHMKTYITDLGLCRPANQPSDNKEVFGVLPFVAPEVLRGNEYTKESDIYGFGIIAYEAATGLAPYSDMAHENFLAVKICEGLRPSSNYVIPQLILDLIQRCWDADPSKRPDAENLCNSLKYLNDSYFGDFNSLICKQTHEASDINEGLLDSSTNYLSNETHPKAIYTSRLLKKVEADYSDSIIMDFTNL